jgi:hypothetical protein
MAKLMTPLLQTYPATVTQTRHQMQMGQTVRRHGMLTAPAQPSTAAAARRALGELPAAAAAVAARSAVLVGSGMVGGRSCR